jgi:hypothetical protein
MSVRAPPGKPLMIIGQDECISTQFLLGQRTWIGPKGERPLLPKTEGEGYMLSAFQGRVIGFGRPMTPAELEQVNKERRDKDYDDTKAALEIRKVTTKPDLTESPFVKYFHIGVQNEGYWNSFHMALQLEDIVGCMNVLYPEFDVVFLFDHSQGHSRKREGSLDANSMNQNYGGAQPILRPTQIQTGLGFLGPHSPCLKVGDIQSMVFVEGDEGPFNLTPEQRAEKGATKLTGAIKRGYRRTKAELIAELEKIGVKVPRGPYHHKNDLIQFAKDKGVALIVDRPIKKLGWTGAPKGLLQVLWERGFIDDHKKFSNDGKPDPVTGVKYLKPSLRYIMAQCPDFRDEETALQFLGRTIGVAVDCTPKFHAELAGEGIEYSWGFAKQLYRRKPVSMKKGRVNFKALVRKCTDPATEIDKVRVGKFAGRARAYICAYFELNRQQQNQDVNDSVSERQQAHFVDIERLMKSFKTHRCALDFDSGFIRSTCVIKE